MRDKTVELPPAAARVAVSLFAPIAVAFMVLTALGMAVSLDQGGLTPVFLGAIGLVSWFLGQNWYGLEGLGLRGKRPFFAGLGFAFLPWLPLLLLRLNVDSSGTTSAGVGTAFVYLLLFEGFCIHLWLFGLFFRSAADWQSPLFSALLSGLLFGILSFLLFQESYETNLSAALYFALWGLFYGLVRLRTGSVLGAMLVQPLQSLTAWYILLPDLPPEPGEFLNLYLGMGVVYALLIWRLWPNEESDYRV